MNSTSATDNPSIVAQASHFATLEVRRGLCSLIKQVKIPQKTRGKEEDPILGPLCAKYFTYIL